MQLKPQHIRMLAVIEDGERRIRHIGRIVGLSYSGVRHNLLRLEEWNYIRRNPRHGNAISLTDKGHHELESLAIVTEDDRESVWRIVRVYQATPHIPALASLHHPKVAG